jgi:hypothetical protein
VGLLLCQILDNVSCTPLVEAVSALAN